MQWDPFYRYMKEQERLSWDPFFRYMKEIERKRWDPEYRQRLYEERQMNGRYGGAVDSVLSQRRETFYRRNPSEYWEKIRRVIMERTFGQSDGTLLLSAPSIVGEDRERTVLPASDSNYVPYVSGDDEGLR